MYTINETGNLIIFLVYFGSSGSLWEHWYTLSMVTCCQKWSLVTRFYVATSAVPRHYVSWQIDMTYLMVMSSKWFSAEVKNAVTFIFVLPLYSTQGHLIKQFGVCFLDYMYAGSSGFLSACLLMKARIHWLFLWDLPEWNIAVSPSLLHLMLHRVHV